MHLALFAARHDEGRKIDDEAVLRDVVASRGLDPGAVAAEVASGWPRTSIARSIWPAGRG